MGIVQRRIEGVYEFISMIRVKEGWDANDAVSSILYQGYPMVFRSGVFITNLFQKIFFPAVPVLKILTFRFNEKLVG